MLTLEQERRKNYQCHASDVVRLYFAPDKDGFEDQDIKDYKPEMMYQIFGNQEVIFGYRDLEINIYSCTSTGDTLIETKWSEQVVPNERLGIKADDIIELLKPWYPMGFETNREVFYKKIQEKLYEPYGRCVSKFSFPSHSEENRMYTVNLCETKQPGFNEYHRKFEPLLIYYIEGANFIELEDDKWSILHMYEERKYGDGFIYILAGFCTIYNFFCNPYSKRARISQVLVIPSYQKMGLGTRLLTSTYQVLFHELPNVREITVESPNATFSKIRNMLDCKILMELSMFNKQWILKGLTSRMMEEARYRAKMNKVQCNRVYNILRLLYTNIEDESEYACLKKEMKKRFHAGLVKQYHNLLRRNGNIEETIKIKKLIKDPFFNKEYLEREFVHFLKNTLPVVEQLRHYPLVQPRRPIQLLLQSF